MSRFFLFALLALLTGTVLAVMLGGSPGYLLISYGDYSLETSLLIALLSCLLGFTLLYGLWHLLHFLLPLHVLHGKPLIDRAKHSDQATLQGMRMLAHGQTAMAYKTLLEQAGAARSPLLNYLGGALAAWQQGDDKGVRYCMGQAEKLAGDSSLSEGLLRAGLSSSHQRLEEALATLLKLRAHHPDNPAVLMLLVPLCRKLKEWQRLTALLPQLENSGLYSEAELTALRLEVVEQRLRSFNPEDVQEDQESQDGQEEKRLAELDAIWELLPQTERNNEALLSLFVQKLMAMGQDDKAQVMLNRYFRTHWDDGLLNMIGFIDANDPQQQLQLLESQLKDKPNHPVLLLTLGRVSLRNRLWQKGREYFEAALQQTQNVELQAEINAELARLLERMGENERSAECCRLAMGLLDDRLPTLPYPDKSVSVSSDEQEREQEQDEQTV